MFDLNKLVKILDWLQRLIILYSSGDDAIPREMKVALSRFKYNEVSDGREVFYCKCIGADSIEARYSIPMIDRPSFFNPNISYEQCNNPVVLNFIITKEGKYPDLDGKVDLSDTFVFDKDSKHIIIFIPIEVLKVTDIKTTMGYCSDLITELLFYNTNNCFEEAKLKVICFFYQLVFIMGIFNSNKYEEHLNFDNDIDCNIMKSVYDFIEKEYDFNNTSLVDILRNSVTKFEMGDTDFWGNITSKVNWGNIFPRVNLEDE